MRRTIFRTAGIFTLVSAALSAAAPAALAAADGHAPSRGVAHPAKAVATGPAVSVKKIFNGQGTIPSVLVSFDYACTSATQRLDVTVTSFPPLPAGATYLKATKAKKDLRCDGARHADFVEWTNYTLDRDSPARAVLALYDNNGELQVPLADKTMKPGTGIPDIG